MLLVFSFWQMQIIMNILGLIVKIMADIGITKILHTFIQDLFKGKNLKKTTKACVCVGEFMAIAVIGKQNDKLVDESLNDIAKFIVAHDLDKKLHLGKFELEEQDAGK